MPERCLARAIVLSDIIVVGDEISFTELFFFGPVVLPTITFCCSWSPWDRLASSYVASSELCLLLEDKLSSITELGGIGNTLILNIRWGQSLENGSIMI